MSNILAVRRSSTVSREKPALLHPTFQGQQHDFRPKGPSTIPEGEGPKEERAKEDRVRKMLYAMHRVDKKDLKASQKKRGVELTFNEGGKMVSFADEVASLTAEDEAMSARLEGVREENRRVSRSKRERQKELETLLGVREAVFGRQVLDERIRSGALRSSLSRLPKKITIKMQEMKEEYDLRIHVRTLDEKESMIQKAEEPLKSWLTRVLATVDDFRTFKRKGMPFTL